MVGVRNVECAKIPDMSKIVRVVNDMSQSLDLPHVTDAVRPHSLNNSPLLLGPLAMFLCRQKLSLVD